MRTLALILGTVLLVAAIVIALGDPGADGRMQSLGDLWRSVHPASLTGVEGMVRRHLDPTLWDRHAPTVLAWPAVAVLGLPGLVLLILGQRRG
ncbi:MAG: hypothetical protein RLY86_4114 [Pseudomonadota bacterium]|jgi:hypothetical protein